MRGLAVIATMFTAIVLLVPKAHASTIDQLHARAHRQHLTLHADAGTLRFFRNHPRLARTRCGRRALRRARAEIRWTAKELRRTSDYLRPAKPPLDPQLVSAFTCIHGGEGAWDDETGNGYHGGLQMDYAFETTYGPEFYRRWGDAGHWPAWAQLTAAIRAYHSGRGFGPWPNTARACGLL